MLLGRLRSPQSPAWQCWSRCRRLGEHSRCRQGAFASFSAQTRNAPGIPTKGSAAGRARQQGQRSLAEGSAASRARQQGPRSQSSRLPQPSLFQKLFPTASNAGAAEPSASGPVSSPRRSRLRIAAHDGQASEYKRPREVGDELRAWLEEAALATEPQSARKVRQGHQAVVVLSGMPRSLVESDFHRFARQGQHVVGWAGGINKVVQAISAVTREPRGQYFVFFDSAAAAASYLKKLETLVPQTGQDEDEGQLSAPGAGISTAPSPSSPAPRTQAAERTDSVLLPPGAKLSMSVWAVSQLKKLTDSTLSKENNNIGMPDSGSSSSQPLKPLAKASTVPYQLQLELVPDGRSAGLADRSRSVLVRLAGSKITVPVLKQAIEADGAERNLPWRLVEEKPDVMHWPRQVQSLRAGSGRIAEGELSMAESGYVRDPDDAQQSYGYTRFVVTFYDAAEARRFARVWHRREMDDERTGRTMVVNAYALW